MTVTLLVPDNTINFAQGTVTATDEAITLKRAPSGVDVALQITGTWTGTVNFEATVDGATWVAFNMTPSNSGTDAATGTANGAWSKRAGGFKQFRGRFNPASSGTPNITLRAVSSRLG